jgi:hypothetical protein
MVLRKRLGFIFYLDCDQCDHREDVDVRDESNPKEEVSVCARPEKEASSAPNAVRGKKRKKRFAQTAKLFFFKIRRPVA